MSLNTILYPPVVSSYMPAFLISSADVNKNICKVYFSLSKYNDIANIANAQVIISNQYTNLSMLNSVKYPSEVKLCEIKIDNTKETDDKYYIEILPTDIIDDNFNYNQYYKVQIRFTSTDAATVSLNTPQAISSWINENLNSFSEWSTVCLVRGISQPIVTLNNLVSTEMNYWVWSSTVDVIGRVTYSYFNDEEYLKGYRIKLYNSIDRLLSDSGAIYVNSYDSRNIINNTLRYNFVEGDEYYFTLEYITQSNYTETIKYNFIVVNDFKDTLDATLEMSGNTENGVVILSIKGDSAAAADYSGDIVIRRASSRDDFQIWEDMKVLKVTSLKELDYIWYDFTIESGIFYKYSIQKRNNVGNCGTAVITDSPITILFENGFLTTKDRQLKMAYNVSIQSLKKVVMDSITNTLGSKYPFVKRNSSVGYLQFPLSGLISFIQDDVNTFTSRGEIFEADANLYTSYNINNNINDMNDYVYEREFRKKVLDFLTNGEVKLFRSLTEGNILIKISDISLTPNTTLGRMIWSFSGTATEIDEDTVDNYKKYGIVNIDTDDRLDTGLDITPEGSQDIEGQTGIIIDESTYNEKYLNGLLEEGIYFLKK